MEEKETRVVLSVRKSWVILNILTLVVCVKGTNKEPFVACNLCFKNSKQLPKLDWEWANQLSVFIEENQLREERVVKQASLYLGLDLLF